MCVLGDININYISQYVLNNFLNWLNPKIQVWSKIYHF